MWDGPPALRRVYPGTHRPPSRSRLRPSSFLPPPPGPGEEQGRRSGSRGAGLGAGGRGGGWVEGGTGNGAKKAGAGSGKGVERSRGSGRAKAVAKPKQKPSRLPVGVGAVPVPETVLGERSGAVLRSVPALAPPRRKPGIRSLFGPVVCPPPGPPRETRPCSGCPAGNRAALRAGEQRTTPPALPHPPPPSPIPAHESGEFPPVALPTRP